MGIYSHVTQEVKRTDRATERKAAPLPKCAACLPPGVFGPSHDGSPRCESGSIASGGKRAHCTCDVCF